MARPAGCRRRVAGRTLPGMKKPFTAPAIRDAAAKPAGGRDAVPKSAGGMPDLMWQLERSADQRHAHSTGEGHHVG
jgi:hypothetical protein